MDQVYIYFLGHHKESTIHDIDSRSWSDKSYTYTKSDYVREPISIKGLVGALEMVVLESKGLVLLESYRGIMDQISNDTIAFPRRKRNLQNFCMLHIGE